MPNARESEKEQSLPARAEIVGEVVDAALQVHGECHHCGNPVHLYTLPLSRVLGSNPVFTGLLASGMLNGKSFTIEISALLFCCTVCAQEF